MIKMKNIKLFAGICMFVSALAFLSACSDDDNGAVAPVFPDKVEELSLTTAGETAEFSFTANTDWTLTSSKLWCKFVSEGENMVMLYGPAGEQNVKVIVTDDIWDFEASTAEISLNMGDESKVIAKITRGAKGLVVNGYDDEHPLNISYAYSQDGIKATITMDANFDWELTENGVPEWLTVEDLPLKGFAGRSSEITFVVKNDAKVSAQTGVISFNQIGTDELRSFPVNYAGMGDRDIEISLDGSVWNWTVSQKGDQYWQGSITEGVEADKKNFPLELKIAAKDNGYHIIRLVSDEKGLKELGQGTGNEFFFVDDDSKGNISILEFKENTSAAREGYIMAFPAYVYDTELEGNIDNALTSDFLEIKSEYEDYIVWNFSQEGNQVSSSGFEVLNSMTYEPFECLPGDGGTDYGDMVSGATGVQPNQIYYVKVSAKTNLQVNPMLTEQQWNPETYGMQGMTIMDMEGADLMENWAPNMNQSEKFVIEGQASKDMFISFPDMSAGYPMPCKALIIIVE